MKKRTLIPKPETLPTRFKTWGGLKADWLARLLQHLDNDWIIAAVGDGAEVDRGTLEAILEYAVGITPATELVENRYVHILFAMMLEVYEQRGRPLKDVPLSHFQETTDQIGQFRPEPGQHGSTDYPGHASQDSDQGQASQASDDGPEIAFTPDGFPFLCMGMQSRFLLTSVDGGADDWLLGSSSWGNLVFSPSKGMAQLVTHIMASPGHAWPLLPLPAPQPLASAIERAQDVKPPAYPETPGVPELGQPPVSPGFSETPWTPALGQGSRVPNLGTPRIMSPKFHEGAANERRLQSPGQC